MTRVILDTSALYALAASADRFHEQARQAYVDLVHNVDDLYIPSYVLIETYALVHRRLGFAALRALNDSVLGVAEVFWVDSVAHRDAWQRMLRAEGRGLSFVDWTTVVVAEALGASVFAFDQGLRGAGAVVVP